MDIGYLLRDMETNQYEHLFRYQVFYAIVSSI